MIILTLLESVRLGKPKTLSELKNERGNRFAMSCTMCSLIYSIMHLFFPVSNQGLNIPIVVMKLKISMSYPPFS